MTIALSLLRRLSGISAPGSAEATQATARSSVDFASMLAKVEKGQASSGLTVTAARGLNSELSSSEISMLSKAADLAEAKGATTAAVRMQGKVYTVDVGVRQVTRVHAADSEPLVGIDAFIDLDAPQDRSNTGVQANVTSDPLATRHGLNQSLRSLLASLESAA